LASNGLAGFAAAEAGSLLLALEEQEIKNSEERKTIKNPRYTNLIKYSSGKTFAKIKNYCAALL